MEKTAKYLLCGTALCGIAIAPTHAAPRKKSQPEKPNIVIFLVDDLGWMDTGCYGSTFYETPHIDRLAAEGMRFTNAYSACTVSSPTRAALMTGKYPARLHLTDFIAGQNFAWAKMSIPDWTKYLPQSEITIAEVLKEAGYDTWHVGKWHLGSTPEHYPQNQGFDVNIGGSRSGSPGGTTDRCKGYFSPYCKENLTDGPQGEYLTDRLTDEAMKLISQSGDAPFYLNMAHYAVHTPLQAKPGTVGKFERLADETSFQSNAVYAAMIESMDESLGRIIAALEKQGKLDNTLFVFTSDNGALHSVSKSDPLRAGKGSHYEGGVRVPLIVRWPGRVKPGTVSDVPVITMDITATAMDLARSPQLEKIDGKSLLPLIAEGSLAERPLFWHYPHYHNGGARTYSAVRIGDWKLIEELEGGTLELYNLAQDIGEQKNLADSEASTRDRLYGMLCRWRTETGAQMPTKNPNYDPLKADKKPQNRN